MAKLSRAASGSRHLRWAREILATVKAQLEINDQLSEAQKTALDAEYQLLQGLVTLLECAVNPYRGFVEGAHVEIRAAMRVVNYLCDETFRDADGQLRRRRTEIDHAVPGAWSRIFGDRSLSQVLRLGHERTARVARQAAATLRALPLKLQGVDALAAAFDRYAGMLEGLLRRKDDEIEPQRLPLRSAVERTIGNLREGLDQLDGRLRTHFTAAFIDSLYPELTHDRTKVADEADDDDDESDPPGTPPAVA